jgi:hypothetical protein
MIIDTVDDAQCGSPAPAPSIEDVIEKPCFLRFCGKYSQLQSPLPNLYKYRPKKFDQLGNTNQLEKIPILLLKKML